MSSGTGENEAGLRKILDFTRLGAILVLLLHCYFYCYGAFERWGLTTPWGDQFLQNIALTGLYSTVLKSKLIALGLLGISLLGARGKKSENINPRSILIYLILGLSLYFFSTLILGFQGPVEQLAIGYMTLAGTGFLLVLAGGNLLSRYIRVSLGKDIFNELNETFPQEERLLENEYSINLPAQYNLRGKVRKSWINIINPFRGLLVCGSPGAGKSYFVIQHIIRQHIRKGFTMLVYDFKYDDLTKIAYNTLLKNKSSYKVEPKFYTINFDDLSRSHRCNPLDASTMFDITDATEASRSIMMGLNRDWITKQGDFFVESPINFLTAIIWFLKKYQGGKYLTLPHVIELMQVDYEKLFSVLRTEPEIEVLINPFISAYQNDAMEQLEGQVASAKIGMARLSSPQLYWVLSANDFTLDINDPEKPKIVCLANNPQKQQIYGAVLSLYVTRLIKLVNQKNKLKSSLIFDEFPTIFFNDIDSLIATARSNKVATCLGIQDFSQLKKDYGADQSAVIMNITGNIISGQVTGETSKFLSERFGKINQVKESISINRTDTSISKSSQLDFAIPQSKIAGLSSGEFVGMVADDPNNKIKLKTFHSEIINDHDALKSESGSYKNLPAVKDVTVQMVNNNFRRVKAEVVEIIETEIERILNTPGLESISK
ncbi:MAG: YWFCY domain-containing protein [Chitinophagaceae bacterium]|nr:YWFCY domain-containing protein [Chitinophagaceae bacterium]MBP8243132.1 YWFCY domain-containing protein [Chitinophagaceae bacterium]HRG24776.1 conjugal transfer protein MobC [Chitinophagaceae bacterium]